LLGVSWKVPWYSAKRIIYKSFLGDYLKRCLLTRRVSQILHLTKLTSEIKYTESNGLFTTKK
jgi:hypothetical protein